MNKQHSWYVITSFSWVQLRPSLCSLWSRLLLKGTKSRNQIYVSMLLKGIISPRIIKNYNRLFCKLLIWMVHLTVTCWGGRDQNLKHLMFCNSFHYNEEASKRNSDSKFPYEIHKEDKVYRERGKASEKPNEKREKFKTLSNLKVFILLFLLHPVFLHLLLLCSFFHWPASSFF